MPIYFKIGNWGNSLSRTWIFEKISQNYFQTEKNHQKNFQVNRERKGDQPHPNVRATQTSNENAQKPRRARRACGTYKFYMPGISQ